MGIHSGCQIENLLKTGTDGVHRDKKPNPEESFQAQQSLTSGVAHLLAELGQDLGAQKFLKRFKWKSSMEIARFMLHFETSLGLGSAPVVTLKEVFSLVLCFQILIP